MNFEEMHYLTQYVQNITISTCNQYKHYWDIHRKSSKSGVAFALTAHFSLDKPQSWCSRPCVATLLVRVMPPSLGGSAKWLGEEQKVPPLGLGLQLQSHVVFSSEEQPRDMNLTPGHFPPLWEIEISELKRKVTFLPEKTNHFGVGQIFFVSKTLCPSCCIKMGSP